MHLLTWQPMSHVAACEVVARAFMRSKGIDGVIRFRRALKKLITWRGVFDHFILACILTNCSAVRVALLFVGDLAFTAIFCVEMLLKLLVYGVAFHPKGVPWNWLDMLVVVFSCSLVQFQEVLFALSRLQVGHSLPPCELRKQLDKAARAELELGTSAVKEIVWNAHEYFAAEFITEVYRGFRARGFLHTARQRRIKAERTTAAYAREASTGRRCHPPPREARPPSWSPVPAVVDADALCDRR